MAARERPADDPPKHKRKDTKCTHKAPGRIARARTFARGTRETLEGERLQREEALLMPVALERVPLEHGEVGLRGETRIGTDRVPS